MFTITSCKQRYSIRFNPSATANMVRALTRHSFRNFSGYSRDCRLRVHFCCGSRFSLTLYVAGIVFALRAFLPEEPLVRSLILCFALSSSPFLLNTLGNGQLSSIGLFFMVCWQLLFQKGSMPILSGITLSVLIYKPTLLLIVVPMLVITRRFKTLLGVTAGVSIFMLIATLIGGIRIWPAYLRFLSSFGQTSGVYGQSSLRLWKYVDLNSFSLRRCAGWPIADRAHIVSGLLCDRGQRRYGQGLHCGSQRAGTILGNPSPGQLQSRGPDF